MRIYSLANHTRASTPLPQIWHSINLTSKQMLLSKVEGYQGSAEHEIAVTPSLSLSLPPSACGFWLRMRAAIVLRVSLHFLPGWIHKCSAPLRCKSKLWLLILIAWVQNLARICAASLSISYGANLFWKNSRTGTTKAISEQSILLPSWGN